MINSINISVSGLNAAGLRLANSASNVANIHSTAKNVRGQKVDEPHTPQDVVQSSIEPTGGVRAELRPRDPASVKVYAPGHPDADADGIVEFPNVDLENEVVEQHIASYDYKANLKAIEAADTMLKSLLDIES